jgi:hypothetical protein
MKKLFIILCLVFAVEQGWCADQNIYIDSEAATGGDGSITSPYDSFSDINWTTGGANSIFDWVAAGDPPYINLQHTFSGEHIVIGASGTSSAIITFQEYGDGATLDCSGETYAIYSNNYDYITFGNLNITGTSSNNSAVRLRNADNIVVTGCNFTDSKGIEYYGNTAQISNNAFLRCWGNSGVIAILETTNTNSTDLVKIYDNTFIDCQENTYNNDNHLIGLGGGTTVSRPVKHIKIYDNIMSSSGLKAGGAAIIAYNSEDVDIYNNQIISSGQPGISIESNCKDITVTYNIIRDMAVSVDNTVGAYGIQVAQSTGGVAPYTIDTVYIAHNVIKNNDDATNPNNGRRIGLYIRCSNSTGYSITDLIVENNIIYNNFTSCGSYGKTMRLSDPGLGAYPNLDINYNSYFQDANTSYFIDYLGTVYTTAQFSTYQTASSQDANSITDDPLLKSDGKILATSPCVNKGTWITGVNAEGQKDLWGKGVYEIPNIGADQGAGAPGNGNNNLYIGRPGIFLTKLRRPEPELPFGYDSVIDKLGNYIVDKSGNYVIVPNGS